MTTQRTLRDHEAALIAFGRYMVSKERQAVQTTDYAEIGRLAAEVINGLPAVRAALGAVGSPVAGDLTAHVEALLDLLRLEPYGTSVDGRPFFRHCGIGHFEGAECIVCARIALAAAALGSPQPEPARPIGLPERVVVGANGAYWRDYGDGYSMCPVSEDNDPVAVIAVYEYRAVPLAQEPPDPLTPDDWRALREDTADMVIPPTPDPLIEALAALEAEATALDREADMTTMVGREYRLHGEARGRREAVAAVRAALGSPQPTDAELTAAVIEDADKDRAFAAEWSPQPEPPTLTAWLIERGQPEKQVPTVWLTFGGDRSDDWYGWTTDANEAKKYATREEAEAFMRAESGSTLRQAFVGRAVEHGWMPHPRAAGQPEGGSL